MESFNQDVSAHPFISNQVCFMDVCLALFTAIASTKLHGKSLAEAIAVNKVSHMTIQTNLAGKKMGLQAHVD